MTPVLSRKEWEEQMLVLTSAILQLQSNALKTGLTKEAIAHASAFAFVTYARAENLQLEKIYFEAKRAVPTKEEMDRLTLGPKV